MYNYHILTAFDFSSGEIIDKEIAAKNLEIAYAINSTNTSYYAVAGYFQQHLEQNYLEAKKLYEQYLYYNDNSAFFLFELAEVNLTIGEYKLAEQCYKKVLAIDTLNNYILGSLASLYYYDLEDPNVRTDSILSILNTILKEDSKNIHALHILTRIYSSEDAQKTYDLSLELFNIIDSTFLDYNNEERSLQNKEKIVQYFNFIKSYFLLNLENDIESQITELLNLLEFTESEIDVYCYRLIGFYYCQINEFHKAEKYFYKTEESFNERNFISDLSYVLIKQHKMEEARKQLNKYKDLYGEDALYWGNKAEYYYAVGSLSESKKFLLKAIKSKRMNYFLFKSAMKYSYIQNDEKIISDLNKVRTLTRFKFNQNKHVITTLYIED